MKNTAYFEFIQNNLEEIHSAATHKAFLGQEFLTWLWFFVESDAQGEFEFKMPGEGKLKGKVAIEDKLVLTAKVGLSHDHTIKGGNPSQCLEAATALRLGKSVKQLSLSIDLGEEGFYSFTLTGDDLSPRGVQLPEARDDIEASPLDQRIQGTLKLSAALDYLLGKFMGERSGKVWENERLESIRVWIKTRAQKRDGIIH